MKSTINALVSVVNEVIIEWDSDKNKLRVEIRPDAQFKTLAVFGQEAVYGLLPAVPAGQIIVRNSEILPDIVRTLERQKMIRIISRHYDRVTYTEYAVAEVLIG